MNGGTDETKRTLRALATEASGEDPRRVVDRATASLTSVERAARFLDDDGAERLADAVVYAARAGESGTVSRGRQTLARLQALERALDPRPPDYEW
jgi:hypothetical protein